MVVVTLSVALLLCCAFAAARQRKRNQERARQALLSNGDLDAKGPTNVDMHVTKKSARGYIKPGRAQFS